LHQRSTHGAAHDSAERFPPPRCHPNTRRAVVSSMFEWVTNLLRTSGVLWLRGPAGAGKTAIAQTFCEMVEKEGYLAGSFFFSRTVHGRNTAQYLFATIAYQLAIARPEIGERIEKAVASDPSITTKSIEIQLQKLIIEPLQGIDLSTRPTVIVIDGLDECEGESIQSYILQTFGSVFQHGVFPICFVISSRPEPWIRAEFDYGQLARNTWQISLDQTPEVDEDVRTSLESGFADILNNPAHRRSMMNVPMPWPSPEDIDKLVDWSSGQFIYSTTILKFVGDPNFRPTDRLRIILEMPVSTIGTSNPLEILDQLYVQILRTSADIDRTLHVLGILLAISNRVPIEWHPQAELLDLAEYFIGLQPGEGYLALRNIHSLVYVSEPTGCHYLPPEDFPESTFTQQPGITFYHKSFPDFLLTPHRSKDFYRDPQLLHQQMALASLKTMQNLSLQPPSRLRYGAYPPLIATFSYRTVAVAWGYSTLFWAFHCTSSGPPTEQIIQALTKFDLYHCFVLALRQEYSDAFPDIQQLVYSVPPPGGKKLPSPLSVFISLLGCGVAHTCWEIVRHAPAQLMELTTQSLKILSSPAIILYA